MQKTMLAVLVAAGVIAAAGVILGVYALGYRIVDPPVVPTPIENQTQFLTGVEFPSDRYLKAIVTIDDNEILVDIAGTQEQKSKGLGVRDSMPENEGMLFAFDGERRHGFWMKGMKFPIDIVWINSNYTVVHIEHSLPPCESLLGSCETYNPDAPSLYVLETVAGYSQKYNVTEGTGVKFALREG